MFSIISFNATGHQSLWLNRRPGHVPTEPVIQASRMFRARLLDSPADFSFDCEFDGLPTVEVTWQAVFPTVGFAHFRFANHLAATSLLLSGAHEASDLAAVESA